MVNYERAIKRPFEDIKKLVIGIVLMILGFLTFFIPVILIIVYGYAIKCAKSAMGNDYKMPEWTDWMNLFMDGLKAIVIEVIYLIPAIVVGVVAFGSVILGAMGGGDASAMIGLAGMGIGSLVTFILALLGMYLAIGAVMEFVKSGNFGDGLKVKNVYKRAFTVDYLVVWVVAMLYSFIVSFILGLIPLLGSAIGSFIAYVTMMTLFGELYSGTPATEKPKPEPAGGGV